MNQWSAQKFNETMTEIQKRSVTDSEFRTLALKDPSAAVEAVIGEPLPTGAKLRFVNRLDEMVVVLPPSASGELSEDQLEQVAGGAAFLFAVGTAGLTAAIATVHANCM